LTDEGQTKAVKTEDRAKTSTPEAGGIISTITSSYHAEIGPRDRQCEYGVASTGERSALYPLRSRRRAPQKSEL